LKTKQCHTEQLIRIFTSSTLVIASLKLITSAPAFHTDLLIEISLFSQNSLSNVGAMDLLRIKHCYLKDGGVFRYNMLQPAVQTGV